MKQLLLHEYFIVSDRNSYAFATCYHVIVSVSARSRGISSLHSCNKNKQKEIPALGLFFVHLKKGNYRRQRYSSRTPLIKLTLHWASLGMIWNLKPADLRRKRVKQFMIKTFGVFFSLLDPELHSATCWEFAGACALIFHILPVFIHHFYCLLSYQVTPSCLPSPPKSWWVIKPGFFFFSFLKQTRSFHACRTDFWNFISYLHNLYSLADLVLFSMVHYQNKQKSHQRFAADPGSTSKFLSFGFRILFFADRIWALPSFNAIKFGLLLLWVFVFVLFFTITQFF